MFLKHPKWATPLLFPEPWPLSFFFVSQPRKGQNPTFFRCKLSREVNSTFLVSQTGWGRAGSGHSDNRGWLEILRARALRDFQALGSQSLPRASIYLVPGRIGGCYCKKRLFPSRSRGREMALVYGGRWWVHPALRPRGLQLPATPGGRTARAGTSALPGGASLWNLATPPPRPSKWGSRNAGPRHHTQAAWGWGKLAELGLWICVPRGKSRAESFVSPGLSPTGVSGNTR